MLTFKVLSEQEQNRKTSSFKTTINSNGFKSWAAARLTTVVGAILLGSDGFLAVLWSQGFAMPCHWPISFTFLLRGGGSLFLHYCNMLLWSSIFAFSIFYFWSLTFPAPRRCVFFSEQMVQPLLSYKGTKKRDICSSYITNL